MTSTMQRRRPNDAGDIESSSMAIDSSISIDNEGRSIHSNPSVVSATGVGLGASGLPIASSASAHGVPIGGYIAGSASTAFGLQGKGKRYLGQKKTSDHYQSGNALDRCCTMNKVILFLILAACMLPFLMISHLNNLSTNNRPALPNLSDIQFEKNTDVAVHDDNGDSGGKLKQRINTPVREVEQEEDDNSSQERSSNRVKNGLENEIQNHKPDPPPRVIKNIGNAPTHLPSIAATEKETESVTSDQSSTETTETTKSDDANDSNNNANNGNQNEKPEEQGNEKKDEDKKDDDKKDDDKKDDDDNDDDETKEEEEKDEPESEEDKKPRVYPQIFVSGMHRSGSSLVAKFLLLMGVYAGNDQELERGDNRGRKVYEFRPETHATASAVSNAALQNRDPDWTGLGFRWDRVDRRVQKKFLERSEQAIRKINRGSQGKTWMMKDPKLSLVARRWLELAEKPICIIVARNPIDIVRRMQKYNPDPKARKSRHDVANELPRYADSYLCEKEWGETWEEYNVRYLEACLEKNAKVIVVLHKDIISDPYSFVDDLHEKLAEAGATDIHPAPLNEVKSHLGGNLETFRLASSQNLEAQTLEDMTGKSFLTPRAFKIWEALSRKDVSNLQIDELLPFSWYTPSVDDREKMKQMQFSGITSLTEIPKNPEILKQEPRPDSKRKEAYFTIVSDNSKGYLSGALVLGGSIRDFDKNREMIAMITEEITDPFVSEVLEKVGWKVIRVEKLPEAWYERHKDCNKFNDAQKVRWGRMFSKLQMWSFDYDQIAYADTDTMYLQSVDDYFSLPDEFYAERGVTHKGINCGIMVLKPSKEHLEKMLYLAEHEEPMLFFPGNMVGCTEQEVINRYFDGERMSRKLNNTRHPDYMGKKFVYAPGRDDMRLFGAKIIHWLTTKCKKPWDVPLQSLIVGHPSYQPQIVRNACDLETYRLWHQRFWRMQKELNLYDMSKPDDLPMGLREEPTYEMLNTPLTLDTNLNAESNKDRYQNFMEWLSRPN